MSALTAEDVQLMEQDTSLFSHLVQCPPEKESAESWLLEATAHGLTVTALCGHQWVPSRDPLRHPVCQACVDAANIIIADVNSD